jgi:hypothetical protein
VDDTAIQKLRIRIQGLRAKTLENGCTEAETLLAAAKVAELIDRYDLSLADVEIRAARCETRVYANPSKKRIPLDDCVGAVASFCNCRVWREKGAAKEVKFVFFGMPADVDAAHYLIELIDNNVRAELGRFKTSPAYAGFRYDERHLANASFALGMVASIADKLLAMKAERNRGSGRDLAVLKTSLVDAELQGLDVQLRETSSAPRMVSPDAFEAGEAAGVAIATGNAAFTSR